MNLAIVYRTMYAAILTNIIIYRIWFLLLALLQSREIFFAFWSIPKMLLVLLPFLHFSLESSPLFVHCTVISCQWQRVNPWCHKGKKSSFETCKLYSIVDVTIVTLWWLFDSLFFKKVGEGKEITISNNEILTRKIDLQHIFIFKSEIKF